MKLQITESGERVLICKEKDLFCEKCGLKLKTFMYYCEIEKKLFCSDCSCSRNIREDEHTHWKVDKLREGEE